MHTPVDSDEIDTASPDEADALNVRSASPTANDVGRVKEITFAPFVIDKLLLRFVAALKSGLPAWLAVTVQVPTPTGRIFPLIIEQISGVSD